MRRPHSARLGLHFDWIQTLRAWHDNLCLDKGTQEDYHEGMISFGSISRAFRRFFKLDRRYGLRFDNGHHERTGFMTQEHAEGWAKDHLIDKYIVFMYDPIDLRLPGISHPGRDSFRP